MKSLDGSIDELSRLKVVNLSGNHIGAKHEDTGPIQTLLAASESSLTALNLCGYVLFCTITAALNTGDIAIRAYHTVPFSGHVYWLQRLSSPPPRTEVNSFSTVDY